MADVPVSLWDLAQLEQVDLIDNQFAFIPFELLNSTSLLTVDLSLNSITMSVAKGDTRDQPSHG